jgi:hypothetical protein
MKRYLKFLAILLLLFTSLVLLARHSLAADTSPPICKVHPKASICQPVAPGNPVNHVLKVAADIVALLTGIAAVIIIIIGGFTMVTSAGNTEAVTNARRRIVSALIGLVIVALAWTLVTFAINKLLP